MAVKYSNTYEAKKKRIQRLPEFTNDIMFGVIKKNAVMLIEEFKKGIRKNDFGLEPLKDKTVASKKRQGLKKPNNPLYGKGDERQKDSYMNMLRIRKLKRGWKVYPSWGKHWNSDLKLRDLFTVHEFGTKIVLKNGTIIQIPPRPAFLLAYRRMMSKRYSDKKETSKEVKNAMKDFINKADYGRARKFINPKRLDIEE